MAPWDPWIVALSLLVGVTLGAGLLVALDRYGLLDRGPPLPEAFVDAVDDPMIVVDEADRVLDCNAAFATLVDADDPRDQAIGDVLAPYPDLREAVLSRDERIIEINNGTDGRYLESAVSTIEGAGQTPIGDLILFHDITAQKHHQRELERQNAHLEKFASIVSHDLRNPLDVAIGRTTAIEELTDDSALDEHIAEVQDSHRRMRRIIHDVLALARQGRHIDDTHPVAVADVARDAWKYVETGDGTLTVDADLVVVGDGDRLEQALQNLFRNSVEHGASSDGEKADDTESERAQNDGTTVAVRVGDLPEERGFFLEDDGPGIPDDERGNVLEPGYTGRGDGTGLGLAIVATIAEAHGWDLRVTESDDGGARFEFTGVEVAADGAEVTRRGDRNDQTTRSVNESE